ncbi:ubiquitin-like domain-containing protein CIP73 [Tripterygium wilfordii]|uniref:ubiquitin-like domain-containing protein CIP73 n=1 Tax=Tripterygium wilfordii TaxID=458696 RepID=UPI0018F81931|nr:ubiquitin-like domain-containing protein CIP73 [Tripterygium wilfordii]
MTQGLLKAVVCMRICTGLFHAVFNRLNDFMLSESKKDRKFSCDLWFLVLGITLLFEFDIGALEALCVSLIGSYPIGLTMGSTAGNKTALVDGTGGLETTIEIKIKTLDSQTYSLRVDKQRFPLCVYGYELLNYPLRIKIDTPYTSKMPVPALKERIASVTGVLSEQQRLICRGRVLKDDQLLSAYHVEDGHTLHMVVRQPIPPPSDGFPSNPASDTAADSAYGHGTRIGPSVVIETFSVPDHGDGVPPEISRIVSAVLGSFGFSNARSRSEGVDSRDRDPRPGGASVVADASQSQPEQASVRGQSGRLHTAFGLPTAVSLGPLPPPVITDSLTTLSQYSSNLRREFDAIGRGVGNNAEAASLHRTEERDSSSTAHPGRVQEGLPTPASLAEVMLSTRQLLREQVGECFLWALRAAMVKSKRL